MDEYARVYLLFTHCLQKHHFVVLIAAKIFEEKFLIENRCHQVFPRLKHDFFFSIKMLWVRTFLTNLEIVSPDSHVVPGNLRRNFLLHDLYEFIFT
jgi:hypothetical protein